MSARSDALPEEVEEIIQDFFALQAAACTTQDDCTCGRTPEEHRALRGA